MEPITPATGHRTRTRRTARAIVAGVVLAMGLATAACGGGSAASGTSVDTTSIVTPPDLQLKGCNYEIDGSVPEGMSQGVQPSFPAIGADQAAATALAHIERHGGTGVIGGFTIPGGTELYAGPDSSAAPAATVPSNDSLLIAEPVLWTTASGQRWLATFLACGGPHLYWIDVTQIGQADQQAGAVVTSSLDAAEHGTVGTTAATLAPVKITADRQFAWASGKDTYPIGRGEFQPF